jgi:hypothetical protein
VRGIEAVVAGYPPTPARSVVKLSLSQQNFYTLAAGLGARLSHRIRVRRRSAFRQYAQLLYR